MSESSSQATVLSEHEVLLSGDGETQTVESRVYSSTHKINDGLPDNISRRASEYPDTDVTAGGLSTYETTGRKLEGWGSTESEVTGIRSYIQQTGPAAFRINIEACQDSQETETLYSTEGMVEVVVANKSTVVNWRRNLLVVNTSLKSGYVTSPGYDGTMEYPNYFNGSTTITSPPGHTVMISFTQIDIVEFPSCPYDYLTLIKVDTGGETEIWKKCGAENIPPRVFNSSLRVLFVSDEVLVKTGFKMLFSFHPYLETPEEVDAGVFNCSVPYYHTFRDHVHCNMERECEGGEDEVSCPYSNQSCGEGLIDGEKKCYRFENQTRNITWNKAMTVCHSYGQQLVTLKTPQEWRDFQRILDYGKRSAYLYVGLFSPNSLGLELMYGNVLQWIDGTMAYYIQLVELGVYIDTSACFIMERGYTVMLYFIQCHQIYPVQLVCESPKNSKGKKAQSLMYPVNKDIPDSIQNVLFVKCSNKQHQSTSCRVTQKVTVMSSTTFPFVRSLVNNGYTCSNAITHRRFPTLLSVTTGPTV
ncbi:hypothetical protein C0Q70_11772 [Pomacea canaliculata]|uniref:CUB domain-containing protein n=1 Tax=Pomacea canaliculata TaxID=400727 RepID=A0A2T7P6X3_POMCA|nr:hypothetical protein C0Q70_11772 [Pomacea canaliculata]